jgi:hypothetical protein
LPGSKTGVEALRQMRVIWLSFIVAISLYAWTGEMTAGISWLMFSHSEIIFVTLAGLNLLSFFWAWGKVYRPALRALRNQPENIQLVRRWMTGWMILVCNATALPVWGLALRVGGKTVGESFSFYGIGLLLILWLWPRQVWSSTN